MEVTNRSLGWLVAIVIGLVCVSFVGTQPFRLRHREGSTAEQLARSALQDSVYRLGLRLRTDATLVRAESASASVPAGRGAMVLIQGEHGAATSLAESLYTSLPLPESPAIPMRMVLLVQPPGARLASGTLASFAVVPGEGSDGGCTTVQMVDPSTTSIDHWGRERWARAPSGGAVGPCWFLARFGQPGAQVRAWLDARYWDVSATIPPVPRDPEPTEDVLRAAGWAARLVGDLRSTFYDESIIIQGCAGRRPELCETAFLRSPYPPNLLPPGIVGSDRIGYSPGRRPFNWMIDLPRSATMSLLAAMVDDLGPARFKEFWSSDAPVPEAFKAAAGMTLGEWYRLQVRREIQAAGLPEPNEAPSWPAALSLLTLALGGTLWFGARRQVR